MNKAGLFGGGWEDYLHALNEAFDRYVAENMPPHPFGASVDAIMTGYADDAGNSPVPAPGPVGRGAVFPNEGYAANGAGGNFPDSLSVVAQPLRMSFAPNSIMARMSGQGPMSATPTSYSAPANSGPSFDMIPGGLGARSELQFPQDNQGGSNPDSAAFLEQRGIGSPDDPNARQVQIDDALKALNLDPHGVPIQYSPNMKLETDRDGNHTQDFGRTDNYAGVQIAPRALEGSKGILYSTLDHEVGGHVGQILNHTFSGTVAGHNMNEVEAYDRELRDAERNGLTSDEIGSIRGNRNWYFNQLDAGNQARIKKGIYTPHD
jgi:hypothetical protein